MVTFDQAPEPPKSPFRPISRAERVKRVDFQAPFALRIFSVFEGEVGGRGIKAELERARSVKPREAAWEAAVPVNYL